MSMASVPRVTVLIPITGEVGKLLGEKWKALTDKQKAPYEAKAAADKKRYEEEKAAYTAVSILHLTWASSRLTDR